MLNKKIKLLSQNQNNFSKKKQFGTFVDNITLNAWIAQTIGHVVIEEFKISWTSKFWVNYYFKFILPAFGYSDKLKLKDKLKDGYGWINILRNTYHALIAYALSNEEEFREFQLELIERIAHELKQAAKKITYNPAHLLPKNVLEFEILKYMQQINHQETNVTLFRHAALTLLDEAAIISDYLNEIIKKQEDSIIQIVVPSVDYFNKALKPLLMLQKCKYFIKERKFLSETLICKALLVIKRIYDYDYRYNDIIALLSLIQNYSINLENEEILIADLIPFFIKYNISQERFSLKIEPKHHQDLKFDEFKLFLWKLFKEFTPLDNEVISSQFQKYWKLLKCLIGQENLLTISCSEIYLFFNELTKYDDFLHSKTTAKDTITTFLTNFVESIPLKKQKNYSDEKIIITNTFDVINEAHVVIFMGSDANKYLYSQEKLDLPFNQISKLINFFSSYEKSQLELYHWSTQYLSDFHFMGVDEILITYAKYQDTTKMLILNHHFQKLWNIAKNTLIKKRNYLLKQNEILTKELLVDSTLTKELYSKIKKTISSTSLNVMFNDNYSYHIINGIGINKYTEVRFDAGALGSWIHEIIAYFYDEKKHLHLEQPITTFTEWKKQHPSQGSVGVKKNTQKIELIIKDIARKVPHYQKLKQELTLNEYELEYWITYIAKKTANFFYWLSEIYIKHNIKVEDTELKISEKKAFPVYIKDFYETNNPFEVRGSIDQVISYQNPKTNKKEYILLDFKSSSSYSQLNIRKVILCSDNQIMLYLRSFFTKLRNNEIIRGFFYIPYFRKKSEEKTDLFSDDIKAEPLTNLERTIRIFGHAENGFINLNQNITKTILKNKDLSNKFITNKHLEILLEWYDKQIVAKYNEIKEGILSTYSHFQNIYNPLLVMLPSNWIFENENIELNIKNSYKYFISTIDNWEKKDYDDRWTYIQNYKKGM